MCVAVHSLFHIQILAIWLSDSDVSFVCGRQVVALLYGYSVYS